MSTKNTKKGKLIEEINMLGPWVHGYFELEPGITIKDSDVYQRNRLFQLKKQFIDIIDKHFEDVDLRYKTICDVGCNAGYFLYELFKHFNFKAAKGFDPRKANIAKARFIQKKLSLPRDKYSVSVGNVFKRRKETFDIVIMPGVLHHLDDHILACKRLYEMTDDLLILETMALPENVESASMAKYLELKDYVYKTTDSPIFGVTGIKLESEYLDGATASSGIVTIPSKHAIYLTLFNAGFRDIRLVDIEISADISIDNQQKYRDFCSVLAFAVKPKNIKNKDYFEQNTRIAQQQEIDLQVPMNLIEPLYFLVEGKIMEQKLTGDARKVWTQLIRPEKAVTACDEQLTQRPDYIILRSLAHQPKDKIRFEFAKTMFGQGENSKAEMILQELVRTMNCDWRTVYRSFHLLSLIAKFEGRIIDARRYNEKALKAFPSFFPARNLAAELSSIF